MALIPSVNHRGTGTDAKAVLGVIGDPDGVGRVLEVLRATGAAGDAGDGAGDAAARQTCRACHAGPAAGSSRPSKKARSTGSPPPTRWSSASTSAGWTPRSWPAIPAR